MFKHVFSSSNTIKIDTVVLYSYNSFKFTGKILLGEELPEMLNANKKKIVGKVYNRSFCQEISVQLYYNTTYKYIIDNRYIYIHNRYTCRSK